MNDKTRIFFNSVFITGASVFEKIFFFITTIIIARYLTLEKYGEYSTALGLATFFALFTNLGITGSALRSINTRPAFQNDYYTNCLSIKGLLSLLSYLALIITIYFLSLIKPSEYTHDVILLVLIFGLVRFSTDFITAQYSLLEAKEKFTITAASTVIFSIAYLMTTLIAIFLEGTYFHIVSFRLIITTVFMVCIFILSMKFYSLVSNKGNLKRFLTETIPFSFQYIFSNVILNTGVILLPIIHATIYAGIYMNAYLFFMTASFIPVNIGRVLMPFLFKYSYDENPDKFTFSFYIFSKFFCIVSFYLLLVFYVFSPEIITYLVGNKYNDSIPVLKIFSFAIPFTFNAAMWIIMALDKQKDKAAIEGIATLINIIISIILVYFYKAKGAAIAMVITFSAIFILSHWYLIKKKYIPITLFLNINIRGILVLIVTYLLYTSILSDFFFIYSFIITSIIYFILVIVIMIRMDDIRIIKETLLPTK